MFTQESGFDIIDIMITLVFMTLIVIALAPTLPWSEVVGRIFRKK